MFGSIWRECLQRCCLRSQTRSTHRPGLYEAGARQGVYTRSLQIDAYAVKLQNYNIFNTTILCNVEHAPPDLPIHATINTHLRG